MKRKVVMNGVKEKYKILVMFILLAIASFLTYYFHAVLKTGIVFTHFFYIPIIVASLWWKRKGLIVVIFLAAILILSDVIFKMPSYDDIPRIFMFTVVGFLVAVLSETIVKSDELVSGRTSELRESEAKYRTLYEKSSDAIMLLDEKGFFDCNNATLSMFGFLKKEDYIKMHPADVSPLYQPDGTDSLTAANNRISEAFRKGMNNFEWVHRRKNGEDFPAEVLLTAFQLNGKQVLQATVRDITERKQAEGELIKYREHLEELVKERTAQLQKDIDERKRIEEALREAEAKYHSIFENAVEGIFQTGLDGHIISANPAVARILGYASPDEFIMEVGNVQKIHVDPGRREEFVHLIRAYGALKDFEVKLRCKDDREIWCSLSARTLRNSVGELVGFDGLLIDITERKQAEDALRRNERELKESQRVAQVGSWQWIIASDIITWSPGYYRIIGRDLVLPPPNYKDHLKMYMQESAGRLEAAVSETLKNGIPYELDLELLHPDGSQRFMIARGEAVRDAAGQIVMLRGTLQDITQRKLTEDALQESEEKYRNLVERSNDGILIIQDGIVKFGNACLEKLWGGIVEELLETPMIRHLHPDERDKVMERYQRRMANENVPQIYETVLLRKDGTTVQVEINAGVISYKGKPADLIMVRDITQRKRTEEVLKTSEKTLREAQRLAHIGSWQWTVATDTVKWSEELYHISGLDPNSPAPSYTRMSSCYTPQSWKRLDAVVAKALHSGESYELDLDMVRPDGTIIHTSARGEADYDASGKIVGLQGTVQDITERKRTEETLHESEERFRSIVQNANEAIIIIDANKKIRFWNKHAQDIYGYSSEEITGKSIVTIMSGKLREKVEKFNDVFLSNYIGKRFEWIGLHKDGCEFSIEVSLSLWKTDKEAFITAIINDITQRKQAEEELNKYREHLEELVDERTCEMKLAKEEAERANKAKTNFLHTMSHELRTPLNAILGFSEMLKLRTFGELNEKQEHAIDNIITGGNNLHNIISQILEIVKMDKGTSELSIEKIPVPETADEVIGVIKVNAVKKNVLIEKNLDPELEYIEADKQKFKQVFINILDNAVKFSKPGGGKITITAKKEGDMAKFSVSDTGIGIKEDDVGKLFQKFTQLETGSNRKYGGTGIGLVISKQFVELHGGRIWVESKYGEGTTFTFMLPLEVNKE